MAIRCTCTMTAKNGLGLSRPGTWTVAWLGLLLAAFALSPDVAAAALIAQESFDYNIGTLGSQGGWAQHDGTSTTAEVRADSLSFGKLVTRGNKVEFVTLNHRAWWPLSVDWSADDSFCVGYLLSKDTPTTNQSSSEWFTMGFSSPTVRYRPGGALGSGDQYHVYDFGSGSGNAQSATGDYTVGQTVFVLAEVTTVATGNDQVKYSYFDVPDAAGGIANATPDFSHTVSGDRSSTTTAYEFYFPNSTNLDHFYVDELRVGDTIGDVTPLVPEPSSLMVAMGLAIAGGLVLARARKTGRH